MIRRKGFWFERKRAKVEKGGRYSALTRRLWTVLNLE